MKNILLFIFSILFLTACLDEPDCVQEASDEIVFAFKNAEDGKIRNVAFDSVLITGTDTVLYKSKAASSVVLPLNPLASGAEIIFDSTFGSDTIILSYNTVTRLISPDCGPETFILNLSVQAHTFDSLKIKNLNVLPDGGTNFEIFY